MPHVLHVAEKPSVATEVAKILARGSPLARRAGRSRYNAVHEFRAPLRGRECTHAVTSVTGHLMEVDFAQEFRRWAACEPRALWDAPVVKSVSARDGAADIERTLVEEGARAQWLVLWLDCDREGENIAFEVIDVCTRRNRGLQVYRARFSSLVPREVLEAAERLAAPDERAASAVDARQEIDLRIGAVFTRFQTLRLQQRYGLGEGAVVSYGPCQFPTLGFVVDRYWEVARFVREPFWSIRVVVERGDGQAVFLWERVRLFDRAACLLLYEPCVAAAAAAQATVTRVESRPRRKCRPLPLTTVEFQKAASRKLRIAAERAMQIAEKLYQRGYISYPRTETDQFPRGFDFDGLIAQQEGSPAWGAYAARLLRGGAFRAPRAGSHSDNAHPAIHPTKAGEGLGGDEARVYEFVARHFLACCSDDAVGQETSAALELGGERFHTAGLVVEQRNYLEVYPYERWAERDLPRLAAGERVAPAAVEMTAGTTEPPQLITEPELIAAMDKNGIGTDATIAEHISRIETRGYAERVDGVHFCPTTLGLALTDAYDSMGLDISRPAVRAEIERETARVADGSRTKEQVVAAAVDKFRAIFQTVTRLSAKIDDAMARHFGAQGAQGSQGAQGVGDVEDACFSACGRCFEKMRLSGGRLSCAQCAREYEMPRGAALMPLPERCVLCQCQVVQVDAAGARYCVCPHCRSHPPAGKQAPFACHQCDAPCKMASFGLVRTGQQPQQQEARAPQPPRPHQRAAAGGGRGPDRGHGHQRSQSRAAPYPRGGGGGGSRGGRGGGAFTCFKCGKEGHFANACPEAGAGGRVGGGAGGGRGGGAYGGHRPAYNRARRTSMRATDRMLQGSRAAAAGRNAHVAAAVWALASLPCCARRLRLALLSHRHSAAAPGPCALCALERLLPAHPRRPAAPADLRRAGSAASLALQLHGERAAQQSAAGAYAALLALVHAAAAHPVPPAAAGPPGPPRPRAGRPHGLRPVLRAAALCCRAACVGAREALAALSPARGAHGVGSAAPGVDAVPAPARLWRRLSAAWPVCCRVASAELAADEDEEGEEDEQQRPACDPPCAAHALFGVAVATYGEARADRSFVVRADARLLRAAHGATGSAALRAALLPPPPRRPRSLAYLPGVLAVELRWGPRGPSASEIGQALRAVAPALDIAEVYEGCDGALYTLRGALCERACGLYSLLAYDDAGRTCTLSDSRAPRHEGSGGSGTPEEGSGGDPPVHVVGAGDVASACSELLARPVLLFYERAGGAE
eukprot:m51a1_g4974 putative dna topoisomerase iii (1265) ;mRNA; r:13124-18365